MLAEQEPPEEDVVMAEPGKKGANGEINDSEAVRDLERELT